MTLAELLASNPDVQSEIDQLIVSKTAPLANKQAELLNETKAAKQAAKDLQNVLAELGDIEEVKKIQSMFKQNEELKLFAEGKHDEVFNKRTEKLKAEYDKQLSAALAEKETFSKKANAFEQRVLDNAIMSASLQVPTFDSRFIDDVLLHGRSKFSLDENGNAVAMRDGEIVLGKDGKTPFSPLEWLSDTDVNGRFHVAKGGAGASGNANTNAHKKDLSHLTPDQRLQVLYRDG